MEKSGEAQAEAAGETPATGSNQPAGQIRSYSRTEDPLRGQPNIRGGALGRNSNNNTLCVIQSPIRRKPPLRRASKDCEQAGGGAYSDVDSLLEEHNIMYNPQSISTSVSDSNLSRGASASSPSTTITNSSTTTRPNAKKKHLTILPPRLVSKNGNVNLFLENISRHKYVRDLFTTMIDIKWRYNLMFAAFGFVFSWILFACIWYLVLYFHDDLAHENEPNWSPCIVNVHSFPAALLFSIETQSTLGFGSRIISVECPGAIVIFCIQLIFGVVVECLIVGMVFAKLSRPAKRSQTIMFSKFATICLREGKMCLTFRVGDVRSKSHIIGASIRASLVAQKVTKEGENIPFYHHQLDVKIDDSLNSLLLIWPVTIVHVINQDSLLYQLNKEQLENSKFEIITVLEGTVESTGQSIQVRSSYLPHEIKWGHRFEPIISTQGFGRYAQTVIDYKKFNQIVKVPTPHCSPQEIDKSGGFSPPSLIFSNSSSSSSPPSFASLDQSNKQQQHKRVVLNSHPNLRHDADLQEAQPEPHGQLHNIEAEQTIFVTIA